VVAKSAPDVLPLSFLASVNGKCNDGMLGNASIGVDPGSLGKRYWRLA
jgi:hypothetical protein